MKILNPATHAVVAEVAEDGATSIRAKYARARAAQPAWAALPLGKRLDTIRGFRARTIAMRDTLAKTLTLEMGKPIRQSRNELDGLLGRIDFFLAEASSVLRELGGKDPVYVCEDVDIETAASGLADGAFYNTGQSCCSVERIYVHEKIHDAFVAAFVASVRGFKRGDPLDESTYIGAVTRR